MRGGEERVDYLSFRLDEDFIERYARRPVFWGFRAENGMSIGELTFLRTYSRQKEDGSKERWYETVRRVVEGCYSIQKDHCLTYRLPWDEAKAQASAREMYERIFTFKIWPPGRGLYAMGTYPVNGLKDSSTLYNCAAVSTLNLEEDPYHPFTTLMDMSMCGVGVGFDTKGAGKIHIKPPRGYIPYTVPDSREGWVSSLRVLLQAYFAGGPNPIYDYSRIRPKGSPIRTTGGIAPGPDPLMWLHMTLDRLLSRDIGKPISSRNIVDICNCVGKTVVSGGKRRTALIALGRPYDEDFINIKDWNLPENRERTGPDGWAFTSNNSLLLDYGDEIDYDWFAEKQITNGEPGFVSLPMMQTYGRLKDGVLPMERRDNAILCNPCAEISLESDEVCNLVTVSPSAHESIEDFLRSIKFAFLYAKTVTLLSTHWEATNAVQMRNRRIGCSVSGLAQFVEDYGYPTLRKWLDAGYNEIRRRDAQYSAWLGVRESIKVTAVKPEGSAALLSGSTPGAHYPTGRTYIRRIRFNNLDPLVDVLASAGYNVEPAYGDEKHTVVVDFPVRGPQIRKEDEVSVYEKLALASLCQEEWADNMVSFTLTFDPEKEAHDLPAALKIYDGKLKSLSCLPMSKGVYAQAPYEEISDESYEKLVSALSRVDLSRVYDGDAAQDATDDRFCEGDKCDV